MLGGLLRLPAWMGNLGLFTVYWLIAAAAFWATRRLPRVAPYTTLAIALVDMPMVFFLILAALSLENWYIWFTAAFGAAFEVLLQHLADVSVGGMISSVFVLGLSAAACSHARTRLVALVDRVDRTIAEQREAERALRQAERMASLGTLAAGVAHEVNTPLTYVVTNLALIAERLPALSQGTDAGMHVAAIRDLAARARASSDQVMKRLVPGLPDDIRHDFNNAQTLIVYARARIAEEADVLTAGARMAPAVDRLVEPAREGVERVRAIVRDLKMFSRPDEEAAAPLDVWRVLESAINLTSSEINHRARLTTERGPVPAVLASEARLAQVFVNLLVNAAHAIPEGAVERNEICVATRTDDGGRAIIEVRDTGVGIPPELVARLFDPFFTTKPVGQGTGLGLSICHGIVAALGGELTVESAPGRGSSFRVALPGSAAPLEPEVLPASAPPAPTAARRARILVIDDDPGIGDAVRESLAAEHDVVAVANALAGLQLLDGREHFDLILCDLMMPAMTGMDLHDELSRRESSHAARMGFLTGGAFTARAQAFLDEVPNPRLEKPFDPQGLRRFVRSVVANGS